MIKTTACLFLLCSFTIASGQINGNDHANPEGQSTTINLEGQVSSAMAKASEMQSGDPVVALARQGDVILPYLVKYQHDPSSWIRSWTAATIMRIHTVAALPFVIAYLQDKDASLMALQTLYCNYSNAQIRQYSSGAIKDRLLALLKQSNSNGRVILLLSIFRSDPEIVHELKVLRNQVAVSKTTSIQIGKKQNSNEWAGDLPASVGGDPSIPRVEFGLSPYEAPLTTALDVSLAEIGDKDATVRVKKLIRKGSEQDRLFIFKAASFVNGKMLVSELVELVRDKTILKSQYGIMMPYAGPSSSILHLVSQRATDDPKPASYGRRVCDMALYVLSQKTQIDVGIPDVTASTQRTDQIDGLRCTFPGNYRRYSDAEIAIAYLRLKAYASLLK